MEFEIRDIFEAAFLYATLNIPPRLRADPSNRFVWFIFPNEENCKKLIAAYWSHRASIDPKAYSDAFRSMKDLVYRSGLSTQGGRRP